MLLALGAGILVGALFMNIAYMTQINLRIEEKARDLGMVYPDEINVISDQEGN